MTVVIVYHTRFGNNALVAAHIAGFLESEGMQVHVNPISKTRPENLTKGDIYLVSCPTHVDSPPPVMKRFLKRAHMTRGALFAIITTCVDKSHSHVSEKLEKLLEKKGLTRAAPSLKLMLTDIKGPLEPGWGQQLNEWAALLNRPHN